MSDVEKDQDQHIKVRDRRRFDADGNVRPDADSERANPDGDAVPSGAPGTRSTGSSPAEVTRVQQELEAARKRVDELARAFQALNSDREDFKQRLTRERERMIDVEKANVASVLLDVLDELDLSLSASAEEDSPLARGVRLIRDGLLRKIQAMGMERIDVLGQTFDPNVAEATDTEMTADPAEDQKVRSVIRAGYRFKDRVIRPARVRVARYVSPAQA
jgi:molecular chaperone GrpE